MGYKKTKKKKKLLLGTRHLIILLLSGLSSYLLLNYKSIAGFVNLKHNEEQLISVKMLGEMPLTVSPTPTPALIPTPTPVPLIGYCLNVPVLMYHHIQPDAEAAAKGQKALTVDNGRFDSQIGYLAGSGYSMISAQQLVDALVNHTELPQKSVVITIDDGYNDIYTYAYPILQKYRVIANLMIPTGLMGGADYLSWGQLEEMVRSGLIYVGDHTWSHHNVASGSSDKIRFEIATGKQQLQDHTGQNVSVFTYPYGMFDSNAISILKEEGIKGAFSEIWGHWQCDSFIMALHRTRIGNASLSSYGL